MDKKILQLLQKNPLFYGANEKLLSDILENGSTIADFADNGPIPSHIENQKQLVFIIEGKAQVLSSDTKRKVLLRTLQKGDAFGVAELFGNGDTNISRVTAKNKCKVLLIPEKKMGQILEQDKTVMYNYLNFLCCRIRFLNKRIGCFTAGSAERRLAFYLDSLSNGDNQTIPERVTPEVSMDGLAHMLDIGRASLYRAIDSLTRDGFIEKDGRHFILKNKEQMLKSYNK